MGYSKEQADSIVAIILNYLDEPVTHYQKEALEAFKQGNFEYVKNIRASYLDCYYCKCLNYLCSVSKLTPNTATITAEAAEAAANHARITAIAQLSEELRSVLLAV